MFFCETNEPMFRISMLTILAALLATSLPAATATAQENAKKQSKPGKKSTQVVPAGVELIRDLEFASRDGHSLTLDLYRPKKHDRPTPVIVFVHGGGWKNGSKKAGRKAIWLVPHGFAIASISYRLTDSGQWPDQIDDCYEAVRWVRAHAEQYNFDADKIGCWGTSAGGHLAALMGTRPYPGEETISSRVQAVCDWFGPADLLTMPANILGNGRTEADIANSNGAKLLGKTVRDVPDLARDASALANVSANDPPFLIMHGTADPGVPLSQSERLHDALQRAGVNSRLVKLDGAGHGGPEFATPDAQQKILTFFRETLQTR